MMHKLLLALLGLLFCLSSHAQQNSYYAMEQRLTHKEISQLLGTPYPLPKFNPKRTAEEWSQCKHWTLPESKDADANNWYRAATSIHAIKLRTVEQQQQMLQLYEAAARRGHYRAVNNLTVLYNRNRP